MRSTLWASVRDEVDKRAQGAVEMKIWDQVNAQVGVRAVEILDNHPGVALLAGRIAGLLGTSDLE